MHVKICGITRIQDALQAGRAGADFIGLVRAPGARQVAVPVVRQIVARVRAGGTVPTRPGAPPGTGQPRFHAKSVLVYRDVPLETICAELVETGAEWLQLHGSEPVSYAAEALARQPGLHLIRGWEIAAPGDGESLVHYLQDGLERGVRFSAVVLDVPKGGVHPGYPCLGGISRTCGGLADEIWCAGGLTPNNLAEAVRAGTYQGVDVARGVEARPGIKQAEAVARFVLQAKRFR